VTAEAAGVLGRVGLKRLEPATAFGSKLMPPASPATGGAETKGEALESEAVVAGAAATEAGDLDFVLQPGLAMMSRKARACTATTMPKMRRTFMVFGS